MFAYDYNGNKPYVADTAGWVNLLTENDTIDRFSNVNTTFEFGKRGTTN